MIQDSKREIEITESMRTADVMASGGRRVNYPQLYKRK